MVGSEKMSDISFFFKDEQKFLRAHKAILSINCIVFERMFCSDFEVDEQVEIVDIQYEVFLEIIKYIYTLDYNSLNITTDNMLELTYAAQKYMLSDLNEFLLNYIRAHTNDSNFLNILDFSQYFQSAITAECLDTFIDDPLHFFKDPHFLNMSAESMKLIMSQPSMNCTGDQLKTNVSTWMNAQPRVPGDIESSDAGDKHLKLQKQFFIKTSFPSYQMINTFFTNNIKIYLYGIGMKQLYIYYRFASFIESFISL
jgi:hypothetical protein